MKKLKYLILIFLLYSCCLDKHNLEYIKSTNRIKILSDGYSIKSVKLTEYTPKENYIELIDSNNFEINLNAESEICEMSLNGLDYEALITGNSKLQQLLNKKYLKYEVIIKKISKDKTKENQDTDIISFLSTELVNDKNILESKHPCP